MARGRQDGMAERLVAEHQFQARIERELPAELRSALRVTLAGTTASFECHGRSFTLTLAGFMERTRIAPSGGLAAYTLPAWCVAPADTDPADPDRPGRHNIAEGE